MGKVGQVALEFGRWKQVRVTVTKQFKGVPQCQRIKYSSNAPLILISLLMEGFSSKIIYPQFERKRQQQFNLPIKQGYLCYLYTT